jgi:hypothetical protein
MKFKIKYLIELLMEQKLQRVIFQINLIERPYHLNAILLIMLPEIGLWFYKNNKIFKILRNLFPKMEKVKRILLQNINLLRKVYEIFAMLQA